MDNAHLYRAAGAPEGIYIPINPPTAVTNLTIELAKQQSEQDENQRGLLNGNGQSPESCRVCGELEPKLTNEPINAVASCGHVMCYECALRSIFVTKREVEENGTEGPAKCPVCRLDLTKMVITRKARKALENPVIAENCLQSEKSRKYLDIVYYDDYNLYDAIKELISFPCNGCNFDFTLHLGQFKKNKSTFAYISNHLKDKHDSYICELCFFNMERFPMELTVYGNHGRLRNHLRKGDTNVEHQLCTLCHDGDKMKLMENTYFNKEALVDHCQNVHVNCNICNLPNSFFLNEKALAEHVAEHHITYPICKRTDDLVVGFDNDVDLEKHSLAKYSEEKINNEELFKNAIDKKAATSLDIQSLLFHMVDKVGVSVETAQTHVHNRRVQENNIPQGPSGNLEHYISPYPSNGPSGTLASVGTSNDIDGNNGNSFIPYNFSKPFSKLGKVSSNENNVEYGFGVVGEPSVGNIGAWNISTASYKTNEQSTVWQTKKPKQVENPASFVASVPKSPSNNKVVSPFSCPQYYDKVQPVPAKMSLAGFSNKTKTHQKYNHNPKQQQQQPSSRAWNTRGTFRDAADPSVSHATIQAQEPYADTQFLGYKMGHLKLKESKFRGRGRGRGHL